MTCASIKIVTVEKRGGEFVATCERYTIINASQTRAAQEAAADAWAAMLEQKVAPEQITLAGTGTAPGEHAAYEARCFATKAVKPSPKPLRPVPLAAQLAAARLGYAAPAALHRPTHGGRTP